MVGRGAAGQPAGTAWPVKHQVPGARPAYWLRDAAGACEG
jgi:hypothetical protein